MAGLTSGAFSSLGAAAATFVSSWAGGPWLTSEVLRELGWPDAATSEVFLDPGLAGAAGYGCSYTASNCFLYATFLGFFGISPTVSKSSISPPEFLRSCCAAPDVFGLLKP